MAEEILLTEEVYKQIMDTLINQIISEKQNQNGLKSKLSLEIETLKELKKFLKQTKKEIRASRKKISGFRWGLANSNDSLRTLHDRAKGLEDQFISDEEIFIDPDYYLEQETKKR